MSVTGGRLRRSVLAGISAALLIGLIPHPAAATPSAASTRPTVAERQQIDALSLQTAATALAQQALASGALHRVPPYRSPAKELLASIVALTRQARRGAESSAPADTTDVMGPVPPNIRRHLRNRPHHYRVVATHTLSRFVRPVADGGSSGIGHHRKHDGATPAPFQAPDGVLVDPNLQPVTPATVGLVAVRAALKELGQPYVWGGAGPVTFDCSGLVQWAYAHAGIRLVHHAATQWNEGRLIPGKDILPGDLIMFGRPIFHVGIYLGAGWMLNAPNTGQYVNVVPVPTHVTGVIRP